MRGRAAALAAAALPAPAFAHSFEAGAGLYDQFVEGTAVPLSDPALLLCLLPLGLLAGLWRADGMVAIWPALLTGQVAGVLLAPFVAPWIATVAVALGAASAVLAALKPGLPRAVPTALALATGLVASMLSFEGHGLGELPVMIHAGLLFGAVLAVAIPAGLVSATTERWPADWLRIGWRVVSSWSGAVALMFLAFQLAA